MMNAPTRDSDQLRDLLGSLATPQEHVEALLALGLPAAEVARAAGVTTSSVRNWQTGRSIPRSGAFEALDDLRYTASVLLDAGLSGEEARAWFLSHDAAMGVRPIDATPNDPEAVIKAAVAFGRAASDGSLEEPAHRIAAGALVGPDGQPLSSGTVPFQRLELAQKKVSEELLDRLKARPEEMRKLHWRAFEELIAGLFERDGFRVEMTPLSGDRGVDLFAARKDRWGTMLYVVQCKRYTASIGPSFVREFAWVINRHDANKGVLATTSHFTPGAIAEKKLLPYRMSLADFKELRRWVSGEPVDDA